MFAIKNVTRKRSRVYGRKAARKVTLDDVWAGFAELQKVNKETQKAQRKAHAETEAVIKETQRGLRELRDTQQKAHEKDWQELRDAQQKAHEKAEKDWQELRRTVKKTSRIVGDLGNRFGENAEHTLIPGLPEKFRRLKLDFDSMSRNKKLCAIFLKDLKKVVDKNKKRRYT